MGRDPAPYVLWCNVNLEIDSDQAVVAQCFNHGGLQAEVAGGARLVDASDEVGLGRETLTALEACHWEASFNYRNLKRSDWPAYQASGESSIKRFEKGWRRVRVADANEHNVTWELSVLLNEHHQLTMMAAAAPRNDPVRLGQAIRYVHSEAGRFKAC